MSGIMNPDVKAKWVAALRSGEYEQGRVYLHDEDDRYCCLGVLCAIAPATVNVKRNVDGRVAGQTLHTQRTVMVWADVLAFGGDVEIDGCWGPLIWHNDHGRTFAEIADAIEAQL